MSPRVGPSCILDTRGDRTCLGTRYIAAALYVPAGDLVRDIHRISRETRSVWEFQFPALFLGNLAKQTFQGLSWHLNIHCVPLLDVSKKPIFSANHPRFLLLWPTKSVSQKTFYPAGTWFFDADFFVLDGDRNWLLAGRWEQIAGFTVVT